MLSGYPWFMKKREIAVFRKLGHETDDPVCLQSLSCGVLDLTRMITCPSYARIARIALCPGAWRGGIDGGNTCSFTVGLSGLLSRAQLSFLGQNHRV